MKYPPCVCPFVPSSICPEFFSRTTPRNFLIFARSEGAAIWLKKWGSSIFWKKSCQKNPAKRPKLSPKWGFSSFTKNFHSKSCLMFLHKVTLAYKLKIYLSLVWRKISFWGFWANGGPKWGFSCIIKSQSAKNFYDFCMRL